MVAAGCAVHVPMAESLPCSSLRGVLQYAGKGRDERAAGIERQAGRQTGYMWWYEYRAHSTVLREAKLLLALLWVRL
jgi:hypothetical protein